MWKRLTSAPVNPPPLQMERGQTKQQERQKVLVPDAQSHVVHAEKVFCCTSCHFASNNLFLRLFTSYCRVFVFAVAPGPPPWHDVGLGLGGRGPARIHPNLSCSCWPGGVTIRSAQLWVTTRGICSSGNSKDQRRLTQNSRQTSEAKGENSFEVLPERHNKRFRMFSFSNTYAVCVAEVTEEDRAGRAKHK